LEEPDYWAHWNEPWPWDEEGHPTNPSDESDSLKAMLADYCTGCQDRIFPPGPPYREAKTKEAIQALNLDRQICTVCMEMYQRSEQQEEANAVGDPNYEYSADCGSRCLGCWMNGLETPDDFVKHNKGSW